MYTTPTLANEFDKYDEPKLHIERLMRVKLIEFGLPIRILIPLDKAGIRTLGDLTRQSIKSLRCIKSLGKISIKKIEEFLEYQHLPHLK